MEVGTGITPVTPRVKEAIEAASATRHEVALARIREGLSDIREALGIEVKSDQMSLEQPIERTVRAQAFSHIKDIEVLAEDTVALANDVRAMRRDLLASPETPTPGQ